MDFVDLHRDFDPIRTDGEPLLAAGRDWGRRMGGWLGWPELSTRRFVVLLAEASCGKTEEFHLNSGAWQPRARLLSLDPSRTLAIMGSIGLAVCGVIITRVVAHWGAYETIAVSGYRPIVMES